MGAGAPLKGADVTVDNDGKARNRVPWEPMTLERVGHLADVIKAGLGKLTPAGETGDGKLQRGHA
jgi:hypothetical protein